jgi:hypothetical protein
MSVKIMSMVWQNATDLQGNDLIVMLALADWSNDVGRCWPSVPALADKARVSERTARYILRRLADGGYVQIAEQRGRNHTNQYLLNLQVLSIEKVQPLQVIKPENLQVATENLQVATLKPAIAIAPEPSIEPSIEPLERAPAKKKKPTGPTAPPEFIKITPDMREWAKDNQIVCSLERETDNMLDHYRSKGERRADWLATWRTWMRRTLQYGGSTNGSHKQEPTGSRPPQAGEQNAADRKRGEGLRQILAGNASGPRKT